MRASIRPLRRIHQISSNKHRLLTATFVRPPFGRLHGLHYPVVIPNSQRTLGPPHTRLYHYDVFNREDPTIYALSTAPGRAAIAVIRISGPACRQIYQRICPSTPFPKPRYAALRKLYSPSAPPSPDTLLDSGALVLYFPRPNTVTGEDVLEFHVHGGPAIVRAILAAIPECARPPNGTPSQANHRIRYAEPGEFTRRAFANNRMDLPQIESLGETLSASTEQQRKLSVRGTTSSLSARYEHWRVQLLQARGELEALIDFSEDQHFDESPVQLCASVADQVQKLVAQIEAHVANAVRGELLRSGINVALLGAPNAGKSSLLNRIIGREAAIVSQEAGTTRDVVEVSVDIGGWLVKIGDMAGLRRAGVVGPDVIGAVEQEGIKRAKQRAIESDVLIVVQDATAEMDPEVTKTVKQCVDMGIQVVVAINKIDEVSQSSTALQAWKDKIQSRLDISADSITFISCKEATSTLAATKDPGNIQLFLNSLLETFKEITAAIVPESEPDPSVWRESLGATERQRALLSECLSHLGSFLSAVRDTIAAPHNQCTQALDRPEVGEVDIVVAAESLRLAADTLARITGRGDSGDVEEVLGVVFEK
ncbi:P-loop containing nucleoside triphosphate hydrolase protein [Lojkania enalia]|uniref:P-loop containing nucleoside triphosphate hydrolase protein n=1 Tax=Lojkania enalia TaxID=147567 RepID=A0A9P4KE89_9PLEO|nr:P-loop containing nucleoside triphosphate hydrolase protein [Didymosphaeria enalia]